MDGTSARPTCFAFACAPSILRCKYEGRLYIAIVFRRYRVFSLRQPDDYPRLRVDCFRCKGGGSYGNDMPFTLNPTSSRATFAKRPGRCLSSKQKKKKLETLISNVLNSANQQWQKQEKTATRCWDSKMVVLGKHHAPIREPQVQHSKKKLSVSASTVTVSIVL